MVSNGSKPLVGISTYVETARWGVWEVPAVLLPMSYVDSVVKAGGVPVLLPSMGADTSALSVLDAVVIAGGADVDPARYGHTAQETTVSRPGRDEFEFALVRDAMARGLPILGVCRGMQVLNVALGGTLTQHLPEVVGHREHQPSTAVYGPQRISLAEGSRAAKILGAEAKGQCYHHQAVATLGDGLQVTGRAVDGTIEAVEVPGAQLVLGVQWHPEQDIEDVRLFAALVEATWT